MTMSSSDQKNLFYLHSNDSSLSTIQFQKISTQVSSVGFNTLKKQTTSSSLILSIATTKTNKTNSLVKLFTRNRSSLNINDDVILSVSPDDNSRSSIEEENNSISQRSSGLFKISRKLRSKLKFSNKAMSRPDLSIQTAGHHTLKVPKKILSSASPDDFGNKKTVSSPISRSLFHRPHNQSKLDSQQVGSDEATHPMHSKNYRTAVGLSSQSSNSVISDISVAVLYNFTNPDYSVTNADENSEGLLFLDFHKMYMTSADHFISSKYHRADAGVINEMPFIDPLRATPEDGKAGIEKSFAILFDLFKPLFSPSEQASLANGLSHPIMSLTMEQAQSFVRENILNAAKSFLTINLQESNIGTTKIQENDSKEATDDFMMNSYLDEDFQDLRRKELGQQLFHFFQKCCIEMVGHFKLMDTLDGNANSISKVRQGKLAAMMTEDRAANDNYASYDYLKEWERIELLWQFFNLKVRFFVLNTFRELQKHFNEEERLNVNNGHTSKHVQIESALLLAFRDTVVVPHLLQRPSESEPVSYSKDASHSLHASEIYFFQNQGQQIVKSLKLCFGTILSHLRCDFAGSDEQPYNEMLFEEYVHWFSQVTR